MDKEVLKDIIKNELNVEKIQLDDIPELELYMDQVIQIFESKLAKTKRNEEDKVLTKTMINNYAKAKLLMSIKNKKYSKEHLILMSLIYEFKGILSMNDIKYLLDDIINNYEKDDNYNIRELYNEYLNNSIEDSKAIEQYLDEKIDKLDDISKSFEEKFLLISSIITISNTYRKIGEKLIDEFFGEGVENNEKSK